ncbi:MAG: transketolase [Flavobacteriia bacterium]|nr:transketolase [Flavobacteriia bacterium]
MSDTIEKTSQETQYKQDVLNDFKLAVLSREASLIGRREVLTGKAKFGIFGDGKELAQIAWARSFQNGDFRSGYYRDQTFMMAIGELTVQQFFASLYATTDIDLEPASGGRQMNGHFATRSLDESGMWKNLTEQKNSSADISPTAGQMPRLVGLAQASKVYRNVEDLKSFDKFSVNGNEVAWGTIGNASTSEGLFFESINAAGVLQIPMVISIWDDEYGISVHARHQTTKQNISEILKGFQRDDKGDGYEILRVNGWDYPALIETYQKASKIAREEHVPVMVHVREMTQPQGHSTSGSHERYKSPERLQWEKEHDCIVKFRSFIEEAGIGTAEELDAIEKEAKKQAREEKAAAWKDFTVAIKAEINEAIEMLSGMTELHAGIESIVSNLQSAMDPLHKDAISAVRRALWLLRHNDSDKKMQLVRWLNGQEAINKDRYNTHLYSESAEKATNIAEVAPTYGEDAQEVDARLVLRENFDAILASRPDVLIFGEDSGKIGDVNQGLEGLQDKYGEIRVSDTGIREATILGQGIGMAMRGLRPIAEIQYLDYLLYALQIMSDDLATVQYRTKGGQKAPVIVRTRGHRLEGIWHSGSPMGAILNTIRGINVCVPRDMTKAAGFYNTLLESDEPALIVECLNGYRLKEQLPSNLGEFKTPLGIPEVIRQGSDVTLVTYGSNCRIAMDAAQQLEDMDIDVQIIDVQTLLPFDINHSIVEELAKTNQLLIFDEDVNGGASAFILQQILEVQGGYKLLDGKPRTLTSKDHRPAYGTDGDYFSKPSVDDVVETIYEMMSEQQPSKFPKMR